MARMRAQTYVKTYSTNTILLGNSTPVGVFQLATATYPRQLKNIRGDLQFTSADATPTSVDAAQGWVGLMRWPASEVQPSNQDVNLGDARLLHPVTWQFRHYPGHQRYEFKGINLSAQDRLYLVVHKGFHSGNDNIYVDFVLLWAQLNHPVAA